MERVRTLYTDIDGTLVGPLGNLFWDSNRAPTLAAAEALVRAAREGLEIVALTGRNRHRMFEVARLLGLETYICELGGVRVYDRGAEAVHDHGAYVGKGSPADALHEILAALAEGYPGRIEEHAPWNAGREASVVVRGHVDVAEAESFLAEWGFGWAAVVDNGVIPARYESLPDVERVHAYHVVPRGVSKVAGIAADRRRRGLPLEACAVVGDATADVACRAEVGRCFLVGNGLLKDPGLVWAQEAGSGVEVTRGGHGEGFAEAVHAILDGTGGGSGAR
ncbi:MAG TPA: HAD hydrolase family protein [Acidimicrobiia bacterium]|nr:HAD hydrolase family protein [Acidimicrobiia bacterium]